MPIICKDDIPQKLWKNDILYMPNILVSSHQKNLQDYNLLPLAQDIRNTDNPIGGSTLEETQHHYALRYGVSCCRVESLVIDPQKAFFSTSDDLVNIFSEGKIALLDVACGCGSVGASVLSTIYTLRKENVLPRTPTSIEIIGADYSLHALEIYKKTMEHLTPGLKTTGIELKLRTIEWQAEASYSTSELCDALFNNYPDSDEYLIFIANFSGSLDPNFEKYRESIQHVFDRTHNKRCAIVWVEPGSSNKGISLFNKLKRLVEITPWSMSNQIGPINFDYKWFNPIQSRPLPCRVLLKSFSRRT
jgi:hypothetical protein